MDSITLAPELERFAAEAVASGVDLLQRTEAARAALLASVTAARVEARLAGRPSTGA